VAIAKDPMHITNGLCVRGEEEAVSKSTKFFAAVIALFVCLSPCCVSAVKISPGSGGAYFEHKSSIVV
jgi:hypothetical protein